MRWPGKIPWAEKVNFGTRIKRRKKMVLLKIKRLYSLLLSHGVLHGVIKM